MEAPTPDPALDALRRDVLARLQAIERLRHHLDETTAETRARIQETTAETRRSIEETTGQTRRQIHETRRQVDETSQQVDETRRLLEASTEETRRLIETTTTETRQLIEASPIETRRHVGVIAESLMAKIEQVGEGVRANGERLDRFQDEVRDRFVGVDRRLLRLETRAPRRRRR